MYVSGIFLYTAGTDGDRQTKGPVFGIKGVFAMRFTAYDMRSRIRLTKFLTKVDQRPEVGRKLGIINRSDFKKNVYKKDEEMTV